MQLDLNARPLIEVRVEEAIRRLQEYEPEEGYYLAFSGGKDSIVIYDLAVQAGVTFDAHFHKTTVDPPEVVKFIRDNYPSVAWDKPRRSMFQLIEHKKILPSRIIRYCCSELKEMHGIGRTVVMGVRRAESVKRANRPVFEASSRNKKTNYLCPIVDWSTEEVWQYIRMNRLAYPCLYDEGKTRVGCIMCPMQGTKGMLEDAKRYPKYYNAYLKAIERAMKARQAEGERICWGNTPEEVMYKWIYNADLDFKTYQAELNAEYSKRVEYDQRVEITS